MSTVLQVTENKVLGDGQREIVVLEQQAPKHVVSLGAVGPEGPQGPIGPAGGSALTVTAGMALGGHRLVVLNGAGVAIYADRTEPTHVGKVLGMTLGAIADGDSGDVLRAGEVVEPSWNWTLDAPVFLGTSGQLTQTPPLTGFSLIVGFPVSTTKLFVSLREPLILS